MCLGVPNFPSNESQSGFSSHLPVGVLLAGWSAGPRTEPCGLSVTSLESIWLLVGQKEADFHVK